MSDHHGEIVIIKKKVYHGGGHHGGAWKIAFADFMTAMMAFFLVLWIINATDKDTKTVIARYFNPVKLENPSRAKKGIHGVDASKAPQDDTKGDPNPEKGQTSSGDKPDKGTGPAEAASTGVPPKKDENPKTPASVPHPEPVDAVDVKPTMSETALFSDPFQALDKIAGGRSSDSAAASPDTGDAEPIREAGANSIEAFRDPFKPIGPGSQSDPASMESDTPPPPLPQQKPDLEPQKGEKPPSDQPNSVQAALKPPANPGAGAQSAESAPSAAKEATAPAAKEGAASPQPPVAGAPPGPQSPTPVAGKTAELMKQLQQQLAPFETAAAGPAVQIEATKEGLLISLTDKLTFSMFAIGSAEPRAEVVKAMEKIAGVVKSHDESIVVRGHTDARPYKGGLYDNWRLSSARAQMAYYMLTRAGVPEARIQAVEGHADHALRDPAHPLAAENRRIEILLREGKQ